MFSQNLHRSRVSKALAKQGIRIQKSVFLVECGSQEVNTIVKSLGKLIDPETDSICAWPLAEIGETVRLHPCRSGINSRNIRNWLKENVLMLFRKKKSIEVPGETAEELPATPRGLSHSSAKTAHLIGLAASNCRQAFPFGSQSREPT